MQRDTDRPPTGHCPRPAAALVYLLGVALALLLDPVLAQPPGPYYPPGAYYPPPYGTTAGPYIGIGLGRGSFNVDGRAVEQNLLAFAASEGVTVASSSSGEDDEATAFKLFVGYRLNPYVGFEGSFVDLGDYFARASVTDTFGDTLTANEELEVSGLALAVLGHLPLGQQASLYGKFGVFFWDLDVEERLSVTGLGAVSTGFESDDGTELLYGAGFEWSFDRQFALRAEWERYLDIGDPNFLGREDVDLISINGVYRW